VDLELGTKVTSVRRGTQSSLEQNDGEEDEDDDDGWLDRNAIVAHAVAPNATEMVYATRQGMLERFSLTEHKSKTLAKASGDDAPHSQLCYHPSGLFLATAGRHGHVQVWDMIHGHATHSFRHSSVRSTGTVTCLTWHTNAARLLLAVGRDDGSISIHDLNPQQITSPQNQTETTNLTDQHLSAVTCMSWGAKSGPLEQMFVTTGRDAVIHIWSIHQTSVADPSSEATKSKKKKKRKGNQKTDEDVPTVTPTKTVYRRIQTLPVYEQMEGMVIIPPSIYFNSGWDVPMDKHSLVLATAGSKGVMRLWHAQVQPSDTATTGPSLTKPLVLLSEQPSTAAFGEARGGYRGLLLSKPDAQLIAMDAEHSLSFLSLDQKRLLHVERTIVGHNDEILDLVALPCSGGDDSKISYNRVAVATNSPQVRIFDATRHNFSCDVVLDGHTATVLSIDASPCGRFLSTTGKDKTMRMWHLDSKVCVGIATGHTEAIGATALSRKVGRYEVSGKAARNGGGAFCMTASRDRTLKKWCLPGATELEEAAMSQTPVELRVHASVRAHEKDINIVSVAPNDSLVATGSQDKTVKLWRSTDLRLEGTLKGHKRGVWDCQFSPHDRVIATGSGDRTVKLWSLADYSCVRTFQGHTASALRVRFLSSGLQLMSSGADGLIKLWTIRTNECEATLDGHVDKVWAMDLSPVNGTLISGGADSKLVVWRDTTIEEDAVKQAGEAHMIQMEQKLANHLRFKEYEQALEIALDLEKPRQALKVLTAIVEEDTIANQKQTGADSSISTLEKHAKTWSMSRVAQVLRYCRDWNTRARNCRIAMLTIRAIVSSIPAQTLASADGVPEVLAGVTPYAERHFDRIDKLRGNSYLVDFTLLSMGNLLSTEDDDYEEWERNSKLVLPPTHVDGRVQVGGAAVVGGTSASKQTPDDDSEDDDDDEVVTIGESDSESSNNSDEEDNEDASDDESQ
jgi:U3 small nucleolar RNA-associated protein 13